MPTDTIVEILIVAIVANLAIMALLVVSLLRRRRGPEAGVVLGVAAPRTEAVRPPEPEAFPAMPDLTRGEPEAAEWPAALGPEAPAPEPAAPEQAPPREAAEAEGMALVDLLVDPATGLDSHFAWERELRDENARLRRYGRPYTIVLAELDGLDRLADRVGAEAAGRILPALGHVLRRQAREADRVARTGPARFSILLVETDEVRAINYVERVRNACDVWLEAGAVALQLSFGWASPGPDADSNVAVLLAEERLQAELAVVRRKILAS